ncbi:MAG: hypothetical protein K9M02_01155 [Thiohalocapsa sp.]|nr:hypothetical protein [Thiohalocapsa sp.]
MKPSQAGRRRVDRLAALLWIAAGLLLSAAIGTAVYKAWPLLYPQTGERAALNDACDLRSGPCTAYFADRGSVTLEILPAGIPVAKPLAFTVTLGGIRRPERVELDFAGVDMDMGYNRTELAPTQSPGVYSGTGMLPICVRNRMTWEAKVLLFEADGIRAAPFRFDTTRAGH